MTWLVVWSIGFALYSLGTWHLVQQQFGDDSLMLFCTLLVSIFWPVFLLIRLVRTRRKEEI